MKLNFFLLLITIMLYSCSGNTDDLELKLINDSLICYETNSQKDTLNIIHFTVTNNSDNIYYFNNLVDNRSFPVNNHQNASIYDRGKSIRMFYENGKEIRYNILLYPPRRSKEQVVCDHKTLESKIVASQRLGYDKLLRYEYGKGGYTNFFIHPNETIHFEYSINLTDTISYDGDFRLGYGIVDSGKKYNAKLYFASDTTKSKVNLPREVLQTMKDNNVKIYHGELESNVIPVKVLN